MWLGGSYCRQDALASPELSGRLHMVAIGKADRLDLSIDLRVRDLLAEGK